MNTEQLIEQLLDYGFKAFKRQGRGSKQAYALNNHQPVEIDGYTITCWRELTVMKTAYFLNETLPDAGVEFTLDGNNSSLSLEIDDMEEVKINEILKEFFKELW